MTSEAERKNQRARQRALRRLAAESPVRFAQLLDEEKKVEGIQTNRSKPEWCRHCDVDQAVYRDGLCGACGHYKRKMGQLPSPRVLHQRNLRRAAERSLTA